MATHNLTQASLLEAAPSVSDIGVIIPTYNAARHWPALRSGIDKQGLEPSQILIVDSSSSDETRDLAYQAGYRVARIPKDDFNHGATRQMACSYLPDKPYLLFLTQDVELADEHSIQELAEALSDEGVGAAYGRQLPRVDADPIERHGRMFNYPATSQVRELESRKAMGFKAVFFSNSFGMYRRSALEAVGGFPLHGIVSEEVTVSASMLLAGWKIAYVADARVFHSHPLTLSREFSRYFDIGVHHGREPWLLEAFGGAGGEGLRLVKAQVRYLRDTAPLWIPYAMLRMLSKYVAYHLGANEKYLPNAVCRVLSGQKEFWNRATKTQDNESGTVSAQKVR